MFIEGLLGFNQCKELCKALMELGSMKGLNNKLKQKISLKGKVSLKLLSNGSSLHC